MKFSGHLFALGCFVLENVKKQQQSWLVFPFVQVGERFKCLSYTLEMPFKDTQDHPDNVHGWSTDRARHFGAAILQPIYEVVPKLRQPVHKKEEDITVVHAWDRLLLGGTARKESAVK